ncbi:hypothetical protein K525DRAFT_272642 [Schizophyllum commune Loenen D]|nr:hypothetical protein K525DRAFT_272642 [Schizophyllum commune Loenen D]
MDENFNFAEAKSIIDNFMAKHGQTDLLPAGSVYVTDDVENLFPRVKAEENASSTAFRLFVTDDSDDEEKELTLYTVGVLVQKLLPPFKPKRKYTHGRQAVFGSFRQSVTLHGADAEPMAGTLKAVKYAYVLLDRHAAKSAPFPSERVNMDNLVVWNPYFTVGEDAKTKESVSFSKLVDPFDDLNRAVTEDCVHTSDNEVQYIRGYEDDHGVFRHASVTPSRFRAGDIVRVGFTVCVKQDNKSSGASELSLVLRSVTLIDDSLSTALAIKQLDEASKINKKRTSISRGLLVEDQEDRPVGKVRRALAKLDIEGGAMDVEESGGPSGEGSSGSHASGSE